MGYQLVTIDFKESSDEHFAFFVECLDDVVERFMEKDCWSILASLVKTKKATKIPPLIRN
ncbi:hypothetical protein TI10_19970 [Photorhabdus luminescens subsp. luminescens]|uniref:hypothetical protein n=1 Tax=Photorhabdus luminescens TaxID=29488 RepID=UPI00066C4FA5|nr:hypothetical protein TI10_19970 [Photorhabdus luminescens subsp. luminescens]